MYQVMFNFAMRQAKPNVELQQRLINLINLINSITRVILTNVCRGIFEQHQLIYSFLIAAQINRKANKIQDGLWSSFLRGAGVIKKSKLPANPDIILIGESSWKLAAYLDINFEVFRGLCQHIQKNLTVWKTYIQASDPLVVKLEEPYQSKLDDFENYGCKDFQK